MATLTNQSYSRFHPSSPSEETPTGVTLRANPVDVVTVTPAAPLCAPPPPPAFVSSPRARPRFSPAGHRRRGRFTVSDVTTLFSRFNRDPDYVVRRRFSRRSSIWRFKSILFRDEEIRKYDPPFTTIFLIFLSSISPRFIHFKFITKFLLFLSIYVKLILTF